MASEHSCGPDEDELPTPEDHESLNEAGEQDNEPENEQEDTPPADAGPSSAESTEDEAEDSDDEDEDDEAEPEAPAHPPLRIGIVGPGRIAELQWAPALAACPDTVLWSVCGRELEASEAFAQQHKAKSDKAAHVDLETFLADDEFDAVIIATPDRLHLDQALRCIDAGKHVLIEKPLGTDLAQAETLAEASEGAGLKVGVGYHLRWHAGHRAIKRKIDNGELGAIQHGRIHWSMAALDNSGWRNQPERGRWWSLAALGTHMLDLLRWWLSESCGAIVAVDSHIDRSRWDSQHDERCIARLHFASGAIIDFCCAVTFDSPSRVELYGLDGHVICDDTLGPDGGGQIRSHRGPLVYNRKNPFVGELSDFVAAIRDDRSPEVDTREGLENLKLLCELADEPADGEAAVTSAADSEDKTEGEPPPEDLPPEDDTDGEAQDGETTEAEHDADEDGEDHEAAEPAEEEPTKKAGKRGRKKSAKKSGKKASKKATKKKSGKKSGKSKKADEDLEAQEDQQAQEDPPVEEEQTVVEETPAADPEEPAEASADEAKTAATKKKKSGKSKGKKAGKPRKKASKSKGKRA